MAATEFTVSEVLSVAMIGRVCLAISLYFVLKFLYQIIYYRLFHPLKIFPGPFWASVTRLYITFYNLQGTEHLRMLDLHRKYGKLLVPVSRDPGWGCAD